MSFKDDYTEANIVTTGQKGPHIVVTHNQGTKHPLVTVWLRSGNDGSNEDWLIVHPTIRSSSNNQLRLYTAGLGETFTLNIRVGRDIA